MSTFSRFYHLKVWNNVEIADKLQWYFRVANNLKPAKYLICKRIECQVPLTSELGLLWKEHERLTEILIDNLEKIDSGNIHISNLELANVSLLDLNEELVNRMAKNCNFCEWDCGVDRYKVDDKIKSSSGTCQLGIESRVASYFHHRGEELIFRGSSGSGTIFFTSCCLRCVFCQNGDISKDKFNGNIISPKELGFIGSLLRLEGVHNLNYVGGDPIIHLHTIINSIKYLDFHNFNEVPKEMMKNIMRIKSDSFIAFEQNRKNADYEGLFNVPLLWNSSFYMSEDSMKILRTVIDIWLPDFKYGNNDCARRLSRTPKYYDIISRNHQLIFDWNEDMVIRHLIMPNHTDCCSKIIMDWIEDNIPGTPVNIMDQYHPDSFTLKSSNSYNTRYEDISRHPTKEEIQQVFDYARDIGINFRGATFDR